MVSIKTTGIEDYLDGSSNIKMLVLGDPGVGKTRSASFWPKPIFCDIEAGRASLADRKMPYAEIHNSKEMLEFILYLEAEQKRHPNKATRAHQTVVVDTIDGYSRKMQQEWLALSGKSAFSGYEAWGFLDQKMQQLLQRLLNLDYNLIVNVHFKEKETDEGVSRLLLQLKGDIATSIFNDFDLVGYMGAYWRQEDGERVEKRGLTFHKTPDRPILKSRFHGLPRWLPITFEETDYTQLRDALAAQRDLLEHGEVVDEIPTLEELGDTTIAPSANVVTPDQAGAGALPAIDPKDLPLNQLDKPTLMRMARDLGLKPASNLVKADLIRAIEAKRTEDAAAPADDATQAPAAPTEAPSPGSAPAAAAAPTQTVDSSTTAATSDAAPASAPEAETSVAAAPVETVTTDTGVKVNPTTGEIVDDGAMSAADVATALGATVVEDAAPAADPEPAAPVSAPAPTTDGPACSVCSKPLAGENQDFVRLSFIKLRKRLCNDGYLKAKGLGSGSLPADFTCR